MMVEVFKTNVKRAGEARRVINELLQHFPDKKINFDLKDCDNVLRIEGENIMNRRIKDILSEHGFICEELE